MRSALVKVRDRHEKLALLERMIDRSLGLAPVLRLASELGDAPGYAERAYDWVREHVVYVPDDMETFSDAGVVLELREDDCDGFVVLLIALLRVKGIEGSVVPVLGPSGDWIHVIVGTGGVLLDPSLGRLGPPYGGRLPYQGTVAWF